LIGTTQASNDRVVAGGFRISNLLSLAGTNPAAGRLVIAPVPNSTTVPLYTAGTYTEATLRKQPGCIVIPLAGLAASNHPVVGITAPLDPSAMCYTPANQTFTFVANDGPNMLSFVYIVTGAPVSLAVLEVEQVSHWEVLPRMVYASLATESIESSYTILDRAANWFSSQDPISWAETAASVLHGYTSYPFTRTITNY
jgi:hypothetical protein